MALFEINIPRINLFEHLTLLSFYSHPTYSLQIIMNQLKFEIIIY